ncbi:hypothetical protein [Metallosphaera hakonensis]|uniref:hypothetical protein n=1 Tax=Metallosphaera hakonensis TaxID=79601 RepID=UPI000AFEF70F|nr:hypothetical protein [Metallosphaera hakonensis]
MKLKTRVIVTYYLVYNGDRKAIRLATKNMRVNENNIKRIVKKIPFPVKIKARKIIEE